MFFYSLTTSPGQGIVLQQIKGKTVKGDLCPIRTQIIDCMDGSFIIRYRIFKTCFNLKLSVKVQNTEVIKVQTEFKGEIQEKKEVLYFLILMILIKFLFRSRLRRRM